MTNDPELNTTVYIHRRQSRRKFQISNTEEALEIIRNIIRWNSDRYGIPTNMTDVIIIGDEGSAEIYTIGPGKRIREAIPKDGKYNSFEPSTLSFEEVCSKINGYDRG